VARAATILIAEDEEDDLFLFRRAFARAKLAHSLQVATDGEQVLAYLQGKGPYTDHAACPSPDLIILDLNMPKMTGFQVLEWLRSSPEFSRIPVCVLSGLEFGDLKKRAADLGARDYYVKCADTDEFTNIIRSLCEKWIQDGSSAEGQTNPPGVS